MTKFFAGVLSVIAVGVLLIAYGLLNPRTSAFEGPAAPQTGFAPVATYPETPWQAQGAVPIRAIDTRPAASPVVTAPAPVVVLQTPAPATRVEAAAPAPPRVEARQRKRDWGKTALIIGGSTASGAGVGAIVGGKKGALIGAAIGGGASTIYESTR
jgi:hypothetical protein